MQLVVYLAVEDSPADIDAKNHQHNLHEKTQQSILEGIQYCPKGGRDLKCRTQAHKYVQ